MKIISPSLSSGTGNSTPLSSRSPLPGPSESPFLQSNKEKEYRWGERDSRGPPLPSCSTSPGRSDSTFHQSKKEKEIRWGDRDSRGPPLTSRSQHSHIKIRGAVSPTKIKKIFLGTTDIVIREYQDQKIAISKNGF